MSARCSNMYLTRSISTQQITQQRGYLSHMSSRVAGVLATCFSASRILPAHTEQVHFTGAVGY